MTAGSTFNSFYAYMNIQNFVYDTQKHYGEASTRIDEYLNKFMDKTQMIMLILLILAICRLLKWLKTVILENNLESIFIKICLRIPFVNIHIKNKIHDRYGKVYFELGKIFHNEDCLAESVPDLKMNPDILRNKCNDIKQYSEYSSGMHSGTIYHSENTKLNECIQESMGEFCFDDSFDVVFNSGTSQMILFNGDKDTYAFTTSGGSESIISSIAAYKFWAKHEKGITNPNLVMFSSAHAAFLKGCDFMEIEARVIPIENEGEGVPERLYKYIDSNTIAVVASATAYAHGTFDDVKAIAGIAADFNVGCHVDNCLGGFVNCFVEYNQDEVLPFDFRTRGVTSISADTHKYGYGPKGMSVCMLRPKKLFEYLKFTSLDHSGVPFTMCNFGSNRSGAIVAGTWAALVKTGLKGYISAIKRVIKMTQNFRKKVKRNKNIALYGKNNSYCMTCFNTVGINPLSVSCKLKENTKWRLIEVMLPPLMHFLAMESNSDKIDSTEKCDNLYSGLSDAIDKVKRNENVKLSSYQTFYGTVIGIKDQTIVDMIINIVLDCMFESSNERARLGINV